MATIHSFFIPNITLEKAGLFVIDRKNQPEVFHQLHTVFRAKKGMQIHLLDNRGNRFLVETKEVTNNSLFVTLINKESHSTRVHKKLWMPIIKPTNAELIIRMCTEIGITEFQFFKSKFSNEIYTNRLLSSNQIRRFRIISQEAAEQSEKFYLPQILPEPMLLESIPLNTDTLVMIERENMPSQSNVQNYHSCSSLLLGPEGGFSESEKSYLLGNDIRTVTFPDIILKVETAAVIGSGLICLE